MTFLGRPPLLSSRYVSTPLPLDIPDSGFVGDADELRAAVADVDEEGWSRNNKISAMTFLRARVSLAYVKDDLIAIALSNTKFTTLEAQLYGFRPSRKRSKLPLTILQGHQSPNEERL